ncbi:helix-turn-helix domain-containing protein [Novosphingobium sp.]|uniref:helix-turn-helix domain-containing protein n=1 Tax=Novosphingobium sp. TaxID=1874826 RepID=UPI0038BB0C1D
MGFDDRVKTHDKCESVLSHVDRCASGLRILLYRIILFGQRTPRQRRTFAREDRMFQQFSTRGLQPSERVDAWNNVIGQTYSGLSASPLRPGFAARIARWELGDTILTRPASTAVSVERHHASPQHPVSRKVLLHCLHQGSGRLRHRRREVDLRQGDLVVCAAEENYHFDMHGDHELLIAEFDLAAFGETPVAWIDDVIARAIPRETAGARLLNDFMLSLWREGEMLDDEAPRAEFGRVFADMALACLRPSFGVRLSEQAPLWQRAKAIIASRLADSSLTPAALAQELGVGLRSLQAAAATANTTPGSFITQKRLMLAQQLLVAERYRSVTEIAFDCGFEDSSYFSKRFRQKFGLSPNQFRTTN